MPKTKTNSGAKKRFRRTASGLLTCKHSGMRHNLRKKTTKGKRRLNKKMLVSSADVPRMLELLS